MLSKRKIIAGVAGLVLTVGTLGAVSASAAGGPLACAVQGTANEITGETNNVPRTPGTTSGSFSGVTISCLPPNQLDSNGGNWTGVSADFGSSAEDCLGGDGSGSFTGGTSPSGASITGGSFTYTRVAAAVVVTGTIETSTETRSFTAALVFVPTSGPCVADPSHATNATLVGTAVIP